MAGAKRQIEITIIIGWFYSAFWIQQVFGHQHVSVLDGGLKQWMDNGGQIEEGENTADKVSQVTDYNIYMYILQGKNLNSKKQTCNINNSVNGL